MSEAEFAGRGTTPLVLTVPGLNGSGPAHWQTIWEETRGDCERVDLGMWTAPRRNVWVTKLNHAIRNAPAPVILCAHSMAKFWGSHFVDVGDLGHINADSRIGHWLFGQRLLDRLVAAANLSARLAPEDRSMAGPWSLYPPAAVPGADMGDPRR